MISTTIVPISNLVLMAVVVSMQFTMQGGSAYNAYFRIQTYGQGSGSFTLPIGNIAVGSSELSPVISDFYLAGPEHPLLQGGGQNNGGVQLTGLVFLRRFTP